MQPTRRQFLMGAAGAAALAWSGSLSSLAVAAPQPPSCTVDPHRRKRDLRGLWIATVDGLNWPSKPGLSVAQQQAELRGWLDLAVERHYNAIFFQVRNNGQVMFASPLEPWSAYLTGVQGKDPGYDPLAFVVEEAHLRGLELHAWFNPYQMARTSKLATYVDTHIAKTHPEWAVKYSTTLYFNPGLPEVRRYVEDCIMVAVENYDIDGVHFDDFFYPYPVAGQTFDDSAAYAAHGAGMTLGDWRRHSVDLLIAELGERIHAAKPWVKWGISPFAVWRNSATDPEGSATQAGAQTYDDLYADTRRWVREDWIDYILPQVYWALDLAVARYDIVTDWWCGVVRDHRAHLYIGEATYKIGLSTQSPGWMDPREMTKHLAFCAERPEIKGNVFFSIDYVRRNVIDGQKTAEREWYSHPSLVPVMPWLGGEAPKAPKTLHAQQSATGTTLSFRAGDESTFRYAIYRLPLTNGRVKDDDCAIADASNLVAVIGATGGTQTWTDASAPAGEYTYVITGLDRLWHESVPQQVRVG